MANEVFISYSRKDFDKVREVKSILDAKLNIDCWMDLDGIESGEEFDNVIISAIKRHDIMLFMQTKNSMNSEYAWKEINFAQKKVKRIVMVSLDNEPMTDEFLFNFGKKDNIKWTDPLQREKLITNLREWIVIPQKRRNSPISAIDDFKNSAILAMGYSLFDSYMFKYKINNSINIETEENMRLAFSNEMMKRANSLFSEGKYDEAFSFFLIAASFGNTDGIAKLGDSYFMGLGVKLDMDKALKYYKIAADLGHKVAIERVSWIKKNNKA